MHMPCPAAFGYRRCYLSKIVFVVKLDKVGFNLEAFTHFEVFN